MSASDGTADGSQSNVLLLVPEFASGADAICGRCLEATGGKRARAVLVACGESPESRLRVWDEHVAIEATERVVVDVDVLTRAASASGGETDPPDGTRVETVADPTDLVEIGATIDRAMGNPVADGGGCVLCFHSLTDLIRQGNTRDVFTFLEGLTEDVERAGAVAHYHMDPTVHDPETTRTFEELFDATFDAREEG